jgi:biopolymer transport protein ExbD
MTFQLLAFFIMTYRPPSTEGRLDLDLPAEPVAVARQSDAQSQASSAAEDLGLDTEPLIRATADPSGSLASLSFGEAPLENADALEEQLRRYAMVLEPAPLRIRFLADEKLRYEEAARIVAAATRAGAVAIRLLGPDVPPS